MIEVALYFDGLCEPINPGGVAAYGWCYERDGDLLATGRGAAASGPLATNNLAEWSALIEALKGFERALWIGGLTMSSQDCALVVHGDSRLVCEQVAGKWKVRAVHLRPLCEKAQCLLPPRARVEWVPRERNELADNLSRLAYHEWRAQNPRLAAEMDVAAARRRG